MSLQEKEWFIEAPWGKICVIAWGNCQDPPVLVVHGYLDSAASFRPLINLLPQNFYYIGMEIPGNGRSDPYPPGLMINLLDLVYPIEVVRRHFRWESFIYMAHSISSVVGRMYQLTYPNRMSRVIEIDQTPFRLITPPKKFTLWYDTNITAFYDKYDQYNSRKEDRPTYTWDQAIEKAVKERRISPEAARATLERYTEPVDGQSNLIRFTFDQRMKLVTPPPLSQSQVKDLYSKITTPTLGIISSESIDKGLYNPTPYLLNDNNLKNYKFVKIEGHHDTFLTNPEKMATFIGQFLLKGLDGFENRAKL